MSFGLVDARFIFLLATLSIIISGNSGPNSNLRVINVSQPPQV